MLEFILLLAPLVLYILVYVIMLGPRNHFSNKIKVPRSLIRNADGCYDDECIYYPKHGNGMECKVNPKHWGVCKNSPKSCPESQAIISDSEKEFIKLNYTIKNERYRHWLAIATLIVTIITALLKNGN